MKKAIITILLFFLVLGIPNLCQAGENDSISKPKYASIVLSLDNGFFGSSIITLWDGQTKQEKKPPMPKLIDLEKVADFYGYINSELERLGGLGYKLVSVNSMGFNNLNICYTLIKE